jgi:hypothetical protein
MDIKTEIARIAAMPNDRLVTRHYETLKLWFMCDPTSKEFPDVERYEQALDAECVKRGLYDDSPSLTARENKHV